MTERQVDIGELIRENIDNLQRLKYLTGRDLEFRLINLHDGLLAKRGEKDPAKSVTLSDADDTMDFFQVVDPLKDFLLEDNPDGELEFRVSPGHRYFLSMKNVKTGNFLLIQPGMRPYIGANIVTPESGIISPTAIGARDYLREIRSDKHTGDEYDIAINLVGASERIFRFHEMFSDREMQPLVQQYGTYNPSGVAE